MGCDDRDGKCVGWSNIERGGNCIACADRRLKQLTNLNLVREVPEFQLVLCVEVPESMAACAIRVLEQDVAVGKRKDEELGFLLSRVSVTFRIPPI
jgi:hypothetical protein